jgi:RsmE family RNA methyltransferase
MRGATSTRVYVVSRHLSTPHPATHAQTPEGSRGFNPAFDVTPARLVTALITERGVAEATSAALARLERGVIEASKQCGRDTLMAIAAPASVAELVATKPADVIGLVADPAGRPLDTSGWPERAEALGLVGPEGGFSPGELAATDAAGWPRVALAGPTVRTWSPR